MGTLEPPRLTAKIKFDGTPKSWPTFKEAMLKGADSENNVYMLEDLSTITYLFTPFPFSLYSKQLYNI